MRDIQANDVGQLLRGRMGLIIGPSITKYPGCFADLSQALAANATVPAGKNFLETADGLLETEKPESEIKEWIRQIVGSQAKSSVVGHLTKFRWSGVLSAALDLEFEETFPQEVGRHFSWRPAAVLADLASIPPPKTVPVFKLMGIATREDFAFSTVSYLARRATWRYAVKCFADLVKGSGVLCIGMADCEWALADLVTEMIGERSASPAMLLMLADDPLASNSKLRQLLQARTRILTVRGTVGELVREIAAVDKLGYGRLLPFPEDAKDQFETLRAFPEIATIVNDQLRPAIARTEENRLRDLLFSPSVPRWDPFAYGLDFSRTLRAKLFEELRDALRGSHSSSVAAVLTGGAVTGKTVLLKRLAWDLAQSGELVLWLNPSSYQDTSRSLRELFDKLVGIDSFRNRRCVVVMDDPLGFGSVSPRDVVMAAHAAGASVVLLVGVRTSEWGTWEATEMVGSLPIVLHEELADVLDDDEWSRLPDYLVSLGVALDRASADASLSDVKSRSAQDTLSVLYWLLPETRANIASSIRDEYHRLGDIAGLTKVIVGTLHRGTDILKSAYEMAAVGDHYRAPLPLEVLVSALGVDYGDWIDATRPESAAWGLLYPEESTDGQTICYRTRNSLVTRMIVEALNGGTLGHTGELRVLTSLLRACAGKTSSVYRGFCVRVLVPNEKLEGLEFEDGLRLYEEAMAALPYPDRTLMHHKGLWVKNCGRDAAMATQILEQALITPVYPYTGRGEAEEHIHTSIAAAVLDEINQETESLESGKQKILDHLAKARSASFFNARSVHVQANLISHLADKVSSAHTPDFFALINKAVADVDHTLLVLQNPANPSTENLEEIGMLEHIREEVLVKASPIEELKAKAEQIWTDHQSQEGFVLAARKLYAAAQVKNKRYEIAFHYCLEQTALS